MRPSEAQEPWIRVGPRARGPGRKPDGGLFLQGELPQLPHRAPVRGGDGGQRHPVEGDLRVRPGPIRGGLGRERRDRGPQGNPQGVHDEEGQGAGHPPRRDAEQRRFRRRAERRHGLRLLGVLQLREQRRVFRPSPGLEPGGGRRLGGALPVDRPRRRFRRRSKLVAGGRTPARLELGARCLFLRRQRLQQQELQRKAAGRRRTHRRSRRMVGAPRKPRESHDRPREQLPRRQAVGGDELRNARREGTRRAPARAVFELPGGRRSGPPVSARGRAVVPVPGIRTRRPKELQGPEAVRSRAPYDDPGGRHLPKEPSIRGTGSLPSNQNHPAHGGYAHVAEAVRVLRLLVRHVDEAAADRWKGGAGSNVGTRQKRRVIRGEEGRGER
mmetsp:Transcript_25936/g.60864  ORF Transcript_25936/g.60864 Transcript_25936/m.60864 type:complete len:385 (-) Transcript_25936:1023-2177(-)